MLAIMFMVGLVAAIAAPAMVFLSDDGTDEEELDIEAENHDGDMVDLPPEEVATGERYVMPDEADDIAIDGFTPGTDHLTLKVPTEAAGFEVLQSETGGICLEYQVDDDVASVTFPTLDSLPIADITLQIPGADGTDPVTIPLSDLFALDPSGTGPLVPLQPITDEDDTGQGIDLDVETLAPVIDDPDLGGGIDLGGEVLAPILDDDLLGAITALTPDFGDDQSGPLSVARSDDVLAPVLQSESAQIYDFPGINPSPVAPETYVLFDAPGDGTEGFADVADFEPGVDLLQITLESGDLATAEVEVGPSGNGEDGVVRVNGDVFAILRGAPDATLDDIRLLPAPQIAV